MQWDAVNSKLINVAFPTSQLNDLSNVDITSPTNGQVLKYNSSTQKWENGTGGGGGASAISDLTDVDLTSPVDGQLLMYDATNNEWINAAIFPDATETLEILNAA